MTRGARRRRAARDAAPSGETRRGSAAAPPRPIPVLARPEPALPPPPATADPARAGRLAAIGARFALLTGLWLILAGPDWPAIGVGLGAAALATRASLRLLPPAPGRADPLALGALALATLRQSALAGWDIAWRALAPQPRLAPGLIAAPLGLPRGPAEDGARLIAGLAPGSLPVGIAADGTVLLHVLDTALPHAAGLAETGRAYAAAFGVARPEDAPPHG